MSNLINEPQCPKCGGNNISVTTVVVGIGVHREPKDVIRCSCGNYDPVPSNNDEVKVWSK